MAELMEGDLKRGEEAYRAASATHLLLQHFPSDMDSDVRNKLGTDIMAVMERLDMLRCALINLTAFEACMTLLPLM